MICDYAERIKKAVKEAHLEMFAEMDKKYGLKWARKQKITSENRESIKRLIESKANNYLADPAEEADVDPIVVNCDTIIRLTLLDKIIDEMLNEYEKRGVLFT